MAMVRDTMATTDAPSPHERARRLIDTGLHMTVATVDPAGRPWVSPVFYSIDDEWQLYWVSDKDALHSENVRSQPDVAIVIHGSLAGAVDAVYIRAAATELEEESEVRHGMDVIARREQVEKWRIEDISEVTGDGPWRIYKAVRKRTEVRVERAKGGKTIVGREDADF